MIARSVLALATLVALAGCSAIRLGHTPPEARPCGDVYSESRCAAIDDRVATRPEIEPSAVVDVLIVPFDPVDEDGNLKTLGGAAPLEVRVVLADGTSRDIVLDCGGIGNPNDPICTDDPVLRAASVTMDGYRDVPCCDATAGPSADPMVIAASDPLRVDRVDIPIGRTGTYEVTIGSGSLPNGILTDASFSLPEDWPDDVVILSGSVFLDVRSLEPDGEPFDNYYLHDWRPGVERFEAVLVFAVTRFTPGAVLAIEDAVVR